MQWLYPAVVWLCANRGFDLFPSPDETEFHDHLRRAKDKTLRPDDPVGEPGRAEGHAVLRAGALQRIDRPLLLAACAGPRHGRGITGL